ALSTTSLMITDASPKFYLKFLFTPGPLYGMGLAYFALCVIYGHILLYRTYSASTGVARNQLAYLFWSSIFGYIGGSSNFLLVYNINIPVLNPFGTYAIPLYVAATAYAIVRYRLMDISVVV